MRKRGGQHAPEPGRASEEASSFPELSPEDSAFLDGIADWIAGRRLTAAAILFLESMKPLNFVGSQLLYFFEPVVKAVADAPGYRRFAALMERRENVEAFLRKMEAAGEEYRLREKQDAGGRTTPKSRGSGRNP